MIAELQRAQLPIPNIVANNLGEFPVDTKSLEPAMRRYSKVSAGKEIDWLEMSAINGPVWRRMLDESPSLRKLVRLLSIPAPEMPAVPSK